MREELIKSKFIDNEETIREIIPTDRILIDEPMAKHTSFKIGGKADAFIVVNTVDELSNLLKVLIEKNAEYLLVGNGSDLLVSDSGYPGIVIKLAGQFETISFEDAKDGKEFSRVKAGAAISLARLNNYLMERGLSGFEFASGIPGTLGGAVYMNAGAYGGEMQDVVRKVSLISPDGKNIVDRSCEDMNFQYRNSSIQADNYIVLSVELELSNGEKSKIADRINELRDKRNSKQPVHFPSAGSTFKRPKDGFAAALIDEAGLRGFRVGDAQVSEKHTGFVVNVGTASAEDVLNVMRHVQKTVYEKNGIMLEPEVKLINCKL